MIIEDRAVIHRRGNDCAELHPEEYKIKLNLDHENIGIGMSGGLDSSMLLWMLAHHINENDLDITIFVWTCIHQEKPWQHIYTKKVIEFVKSEFPDVKFGEHMIRMTNAKDYIEFMRKFMEIKIITLNKSYGEHFISYKDFSGNNLEYKENNKIISIKKLAILKRQGIYSV
jgi:tRNA(Ile)-lysidine synthase TilS/MesJ